MSLRECMEKHTYREYLAWQEWLNNDYNEPSRTDYYLMQLTAVIASTFSSPSSTSKITVDKFRIPFNWSRKPKQKQTVASAAAMAKARWFAVTGYKPKGNRNGSAT